MAIIMSCLDGFLMQCPLCGESQTVKAPISMEAFRATVARFDAMHQLCEWAEDEEGGNE